MKVKIIVVLHTLAFAKADDLVLPYDKVAFTATGEPCIGGCSPKTHQCVGSFPPKNEPCILHDIPAPRFKTTQSQRNFEYCLSNCGYYEWEQAWCFVTSDGKWDYCITEEKPENKRDKVLPYTKVAFTKTGKPCIGGCSPDTKQCVAHWPPKNEPCILHDKPAPVYQTLQKRTNYSECLSNCGPFSWSGPWCYVTSDGEHDECTTDFVPPKKTTTTTTTTTTSTTTTTTTTTTKAPPLQIVEEEQTIVEVLPYTTIAFTKTGKPCVGGCSPITKQCVTKWPPKNEPCVLCHIPAPKYKTLQKTSRHSECLSNCGTFDSDDSWCFVSSDGWYDYCINEDETTVTSCP